MSGVVPTLRRVSRSALGRLLQWPARLIPSDRALPILWGGLRGGKWVVGSSFRSCWLGVYEYEKQRLFADAVKLGQVVYDVGANVGFYTLLASRLVGPTGKVVAFEPLPRNLAFLRRHVEMNDRHGNVTVVAAAVSDRAGTARFDPGPMPEMGRLSSAGTVEVRTVALDQWIAEQGAPAPGFIKIDVEGAEASVLRGARALLTGVRPDVLVATHGDAEHEDCRGILQDLGYSWEELDEGPGPYREVRARPLARTGEAVGGSTSAAAV